MTLPTLNRNTDENPCDYRTITTSKCRLANDATVPGGNCSGCACYTTSIQDELDKIGVARVPSDNVVLVFNGGIIGR